MQFDFLHSEGIKGLNKSTDIIIISYNCRDHTVRCIESILGTAKASHFGIIVVDNASEDDTIQVLEKDYPGIMLIKSDKNLGYAAAVNIGASYSNSDNLIISNADVIYHEDSLKVLCEYLDKSDEVGVVGPQQQYPDGSWEYSYGDIPGLMLAFKDFLLISSFQRALRKFFWPKWKIDRHPREVDYIDGAVMAVRKEVFELAKGFDEDYFFFTEEADFCYRLKKMGFVVVFNPKATVTHVRGGSSGTNTFDQAKADIFIRSKVLFCRKHFISFTGHIYIAIERLHTGIMKSAWKLITGINGNKPGSKSLAKYEFFTVIHESWKKVKYD